MPKEATELKERLESYRQTLGTLGMRDYQVRDRALNSRQCPALLVVLESRLDGNPTAMRLEATTADSTHLLSTVLLHAKRAVVTSTISRLGVYLFIMTLSGDKLTRM